MLTLSEMMHPEIEKRTRLRVRLSESLIVHLCCSANGISTAFVACASLAADYVRPAQVSPALPTTEPLFTPPSIMYLGLTQTGLWARVFLGPIVLRSGQPLAKVRVMYWKEIPVQVQAADESGQVSKPFDDRFQQGVDAIATFDGSEGSDDYLMAWEWGDYTDVEGSAQEAAGSMAERFNSRFPRDFVARIRALHRSGQRDPRPGAIDSWLDESSES